MAVYPDYLGVSLGAPRIMAEVPVDPEQKYAQLILNWRLDPMGFLDSRQRKMHLIPQIWSGANPTPWANDGVLAMGFALMDGGSRPEILFLTKTGVWRYAPWTRISGAAGYRGLEQLLEYRHSDTSPVVTNSVTPQSNSAFRPQIRSVGNRVYFTFADGGGAWVWDGDRLRRFGFALRPSAPDVVGPARLSGAASSVNAGGFSHKGRIGTTDSNITKGVESTGVGANYAYAKQVGGIRDGRWRYAVVFENVDGAYSATSVPGGLATIRFRAADPDASPALLSEELRRRFWVRNIPVGPPGTVARILLRTPNLDFLPLGDVGKFRFLHRIANNVATEWVDDIPDGELGGLWEQREETPIGFYFLESFGGSMWMLRTEGFSSRAWWSEQDGPFGPINESVKSGHWRDLWPETGPITGTITARPPVGDGSSVMFVGKGSAMHYIAGSYPDWEYGTLHRSAGLAGPDLIQNCPDGSVIWYGSGTFWRFDPTDGSVIDIGSPIRRQLRKTSITHAHRGTSWVDESVGEVRFALPTGDRQLPDFQFVWDYLHQGWRLANDIWITASLSAPGTDIVLLAGHLQFPPGTVVPAGTNPSVWIYGKSYVGENHTPMQAVYQSGWTSLSGAGPELHTEATAWHAVLTMKETAYGTVAVSTFLDWNIDASTNTEVATTYYPDNINDGSGAPGVPFLANTASTQSVSLPAVYGTDVWRSSRTFTQEVAIGAESHQVLLVEVVSDGPAMLYNISAYGPAVATPGGRTPQS